MPIKTVRVNLGGRERTLKMNMNALAAFEEQAGQSLSSEHLLKMSVGTLRKLLWSMLITDEPDLGITEVGSLVDFDNLREVTQAVAAEMTNKMPAVKENARPTLAATDAATGTESESSPAAA